MNGFKEKLEITQENIEEMCLLAEDVVDQLYMNFQDYDTEGDDILTKYDPAGSGLDEETRSLIRRELASMDELPESRLLYDLFRRGDDIGKVRYYTLEDIRPWIQPILPKALKLFRKGTNDCGEAPYRAADCVPDDYLIAAFAREVRNMMMIFAGQRMQSARAPRYLLLLEWPEIHDMDEWKGIYFDGEDLKRAYDALASELEEEKERGPADMALRAAIWEFRPVQEWEDSPGGGQRRLCAGQKIWPVKPEELSCFKKKN